MVFFSGILALLLRILGISWKINKTLVIVAVIFLIVGIIITFAQERQYAYYESLKEWPRTVATIMETGMTGERAILPEIRYEYQVNGRRYEGRSDLNIPGFGTRKRRQQTARIIIAEYPPGKKITIAYNPDNPQISRLRISPPWNLYGKLGFGTFLFGTGLFVLILKLTPGRKKSN